MASTHYPDFNDLTSEEQEFVKEKKIAGDRTIDEWLTFFTPLALFDKKGDLIRRSGNYIKALLAFLIVFGLFMGYLSLFNEIAPKEFIVPGIIIVVSALLLIITNKWFDKYEGRDLPNLLRGFLVPFLELLKNKSGSQETLNLQLDLSGIDGLEEELAKDEKTDVINYLVASVKLPDSGLLELKVDGMGTKRPFYSRYKLRPFYSRYKLIHTIVLTNSYDSTIFRLSGNGGSFEISEKDNKIIIKDAYNEQSESPIESDPGPNLEQFWDRLDAMSSVVERKS